MDHLRTTLWLLNTTALTARRSSAVGGTKRRMLETSPVSTQQQLSAMRLIRHTGPTIPFPRETRRVVFTAGDTTSIETCSALGNSLDFITSPSQLMSSTTVPPVKV